MSRLAWIDPDTQDFPDVEMALREPEGLLAVGGSLTPECLIAAYQRGIFPWYGEDQPVLWWSPDPRTVLFPERLKVSRSLRKVLAKGISNVTFDTAFRAVMEACAQPRKDGNGTWITPAMIEAYCRLHELSIAHSVEIWSDGQLAGGLYGVALGRVFFGESMFSRQTDASKVALVALVQRLKAWGFHLIDCQMPTEHLFRLGAELVPRRKFTQLLEQWCKIPGPLGPWR